jgi:hypothetical protein
MIVVLKILKLILICNQFFSKDLRINQITFFLIVNYFMKTINSLKLLEKNGIIGSLISDFIFLKTRMGSYQKIT